MLYASCLRQFVTQCSSQSGTPILGNKPCSFFVSWFWSCSEIKTFFGVEYCGRTWLRLVSPQHFDHCDDEYCCRWEYRQRWTTFDLLNGKWTTAKKFESWLFGRLSVVRVNWRKGRRSKEAFKFLYCGQFINPVDKPISMLTDLHCIPL